MHFSVDVNILQHMIDSQAEFLMEVTDKTKADVKVRNVSSFSFPRGLLYAHIEIGSLGWNLDRL